jgi:Tfp pilus assembly protein PilW
LDIDRRRALSDARRVHARRGSSGHTLVELLVGVALLGLVLSGVLALLRSGLDAYGWGRARVESQQSARVALERMVKELRDAGYDPAAAGIDAVVAAEPARVTFQRDLNGNGAVDPTSERVTFVLRAGDSVLRRDAGAGAQPLAEHVRRLAFTYFDGAGAETSDPREVTSIRIHLEVGRARAAAVMSSHVTLRNRRG